MLRPDLDQRLRAEEGAVAAPEVQVSAEGVLARVRGRRAERRMAFGTGAALVGLVLLLGLRVYVGSFEVTHTSGEPGGLLAQTSVPAELAPSFLSDLDRLQSAAMAASAPLGIHALNLLPGEEVGTDRMWLLLRWEQRSLQLRDQARAAEGLALDHRILTHGATSSVANRARVRLREVGETIPDPEIK